MKSAGKARSNGLYRHIRTSKEIIRNLLNDSIKNMLTDRMSSAEKLTFLSAMESIEPFSQYPKSIAKLKKEASENA